MKYKNMSFKSWTCTRQVKITKLIRYSRYLFCITEFKNNFIVNKINSSLLMTMVDREDDQFKDFWVPQIQVKLRAVSKGPQQKSFRSKREAYQEDLSRPWIISENIENTNNDMILNIVIVDENDNAPIFNQTPSVIGYPNATNVAPPYLVQITVSSS